ncbi:ead/Ea22-like family protein [Pantoea septica]|uniref:ead/Ea22-like family protein n=1 Tax=Pantoea septica TaxID=472695 RepID=UPI00289F1AB4|nr:ead/Ea22-like family protein [Pantoea septica]
MNHSDIEHMAQGFPPSSIGKDHEEVVVFLAKSLLDAQQKLDAVKALAGVAGAMNGVASDGFAKVVAERDALAAENAHIKTMNDILSEELRGYESDGAFDSPVAHKLWHSNSETPATAAYLNSVRAEGIYFAANRMLAAWDSGFIDDTPAQAYDISGAVLIAVEFLPNASPEEFQRDFADSIRREIKASAGKDGE